MRVLHHGQRLLVWPLARLYDIAYFLLALKPPSVGIFAIKVQSNIFLGERQLFHPFSVNLVLLVVSNLLDKLVYEVARFDPVLGLDDQWSLEWGWDVVGSKYIFEDAAIRP